MPKHAAETSLTSQGEALALGGGDDQPAGLIGWFDADRPGGGTGARDNFGRANSAVTPGTADVGGAWAVDSGTLGINNGALYNPSSGTFTRGAIESGLGDLQAEWIVDFHATSGDVLCLLRYQNSTNHVFLQVRSTNTPSTVLQIVKKVAGTDTGLTNGFLNTGTGLSLNGYHQIRVVARGGEYLVYVDDVLKLSATDPAATPSLADQTKVGVGYNTADAGSVIPAMSATIVRPKNGDGMAAWTDRAQGLSAKQSTVASRPTFREGVLNGRAVVEFDGTDDSLTSTVPAIGKPGTFFCVLYRDPASTTIDTFQGVSATGGTAFRLTTGGVPELSVTNVGNVGTATGSVPTDRFCVVTATHEADGTAVFYIDGLPAWGTRNNVATSGTPTFLIGRAQGAGEHFQGQIAEWQAYDRVLPGDEIARRHDALAAKWGLPQNRLGQPRNVLQANPRMRGSNLHPSQAQFTAAGSNPIWAYVWGPNYSQSWNESSVDAAEAAGANAFRAIGDPYGPASALYTRASYLARQTALIDYCETKGLRYYASGGDLRHISTGVSMGAIRDEIVAFAALCATKPNVVAFELLQEFGVIYKGAEATMTKDAAIGFLVELSAAVRAVAPNLPLSVSDPGTYRGGLNAFRERQADPDIYRTIDPLVDFYDVHIYPTPGTPVLDQEIAPIIAGTSKPVVIGEYGMTRASSTSGQRGAAFTELGTVLANNPRVQGAFNWAARTDNYGFVNEAGTYVGSDIEAGFRTWPTAPATAPPRRPRLPTPIPDATTFRTRLGHLNLKAEGMLLNGTNERDHFLSLINRANTEGKELVHPGGILGLGSKIVTQLPVPANGFRFRGNGPEVSRVHQTTGTSTEALIDLGLYGSLFTNPQNLTANANQGSRTVVATDASGYAVGDTLLISSSALWPASDKSAPQGELIKVASKATNTITTVEPLDDTYTTANTATVRKVNVTTGGLIEGLSFHNEDPGTHSEGFIRLGGFQRVTVRDVAMFGGDSFGIAFQDCDDWTADNIQFYDFNDNATAGRYCYGVEARASSRNGRVNNIFMRGGRHAFTTTSDSSVRGIPRHITVSNGLATAMTNTCWDTHPEGEQIHFNDLHAHQTKAWGFALRAPNSDMSNCTVDENVGAGLWVRAVNCRVNGFRTRRARGGTIFSVSGDPGTVYEGQGVRIGDGPTQTVDDCFLDDLYIEDPDHDGIYIATLADRHVITGAKIKRPGRSGSATNGFRFAGTSSGHRIIEPQIDNASIGFFGVSTVTDVHIQGGRFNTVGTLIGGTWYPTLSMSQNVEDYYGSWNTIGNTPGSIGFAGTPTAAPATTVGTGGVTLPLTNGTVPITQTSVLSDNGGSFTLGGHVIVYSGRSTTSGAGNATGAYTLGSASGTYASGTALGFVSIGYGPLTIYERFGDYTGTSNRPIPGTTQAAYGIAAYYGPTVDDSMEGFSILAAAKDTTVPYVQNKPITAFEAIAQIEGANTLPGGVTAPLLAAGARTMVIGTSRAKTVIGFKLSHNSVGSTFGFTEEYNGLYQPLPALVTYTTLNGAVSSGATTIVVTNGTLVPQATVAFPAVVMIGGTADGIGGTPITYTGVSTNTLTGVTGVPAAGFVTGANVQNNAYGVNVKDRIGVKAGFVLGDTAYSGSVTAATRGGSDSIASMLNIVGPTNAEITGGLTQLRLNAGNAQTKSVMQVFDTGGTNRFSISAAAQVIMNGSAINMQQSGVATARLDSSGYLQLGNVQATVGTTHSKLFSGTGSPVGLTITNAANGDFYFRIDGGAATSIYQLRAGTWTATGA